MSRIERIRNRLESTAPIETPGTWYHEDISYLLSKAVRTMKDRDEWKDYAEASTDYYKDEVERLTAENTRLQADKDYLIELVKDREKTVGEKAIEINSLRAERDKAIADIPHKCWKCVHGQSVATHDCELAHYTGSSDDCQSWEWRGTERGAGE